MDSGYLSALNEQQRAAVRHGEAAEGLAGNALLIIAGAGSGKTNTLAYRVAHLIAQGADPQRMLLLTFSRRASVEMTRRVEHIVGSTIGADARRLAWAGTFHAIGARLLREYAPHIGLDAAFSIHDREDAADLMNLVRHELDLSTKETRFPRKETCLSIYSRVVNTEAPLEDVLDEVFPWCRDWAMELRELFGAYVEAKQRQAVLDYDDLLLYWARMMSVPDLAANVAARFDHVLVDEYQDTNRLQASILLALKPDGRGLTVVGDDAQAIYSFRAATIRNILDFPGQFDTPAKVVTLDRNYRSTQAILEASNAVIGLARERFTKNLWTDRPSEQRPWLVTVNDEIAQAKYVATQILENREAGIGLRSQAVLFRASHHSAILEVELTRRNIPYVKFGGLKFLDTAHVKDLLALLRWSENLKDRISGFRILQLLPGIGPKTAGTILDRITQALSPLEGLSSFAPPKAAKIAWLDFIELMQRLRGNLTGWPSELDTVREWYRPYLEQRWEDAHIRDADLAQLVQIAYGFPSRERFLTEVTLDPPDAASDQSGPPSLDEDYLILSTIHSAKGQEWRSVFVLNSVDGCIPSDLGVGSEADIEEERRLLYVAMTRAKDDLHLTMPYRFHVHNQAGGGDRHVTAMRTRFIPSSILSKFEQRVWSEERATVAAAPAVSGKIDLTASVRQMWK
ncbi:MAG: ATP-dependent helicase [Rhodospirillaceae bacterium]|nr:MAG: ATP-dependent helicase [Rhodospirillaceae bacterium]